MTTGLLTTTLGRNAIIADLGGGADLLLTHVAWGDANGVPYAPNEAQTTLVNERYRATIAAVAVVAGAIVVDAIIPADTADGSGRPSHGFNVAEVGLFSSTGTLIGLARCGNGYKPVPSSGQAAAVTYRLKLAVANPSAISVVIDPQAQIALGRHVRVPWLTVDGVLNAPPANPNQGDTYIIGTAPTGAWAGFASRIAQWVGVWSLATAPIGHLVSNNAVDVGDPGRCLRRTATGWVPAIASQTDLGFVRLATLAETAAGTEASKVVSPAVLKFAARLRLQADITLYVNSLTGSNANNGQSAGSAFLTRQRAWDYIANEIDLNGQIALIQCTNNFSDAFAAVSAPIGSARGVGAVTFRGDLANPAACLIATTNQSCWYGQGGAQFTVEGFKLQTAGANTSGIAGNVGATIAFRAIEFGQCVLSHINASSGGFIQAVGNYSVTGNAAIHGSANRGGNLTLDGAIATLVGSPSFSNAWAYSSDRGGFSAIGSLYTGGAIGKRYDVSSGAIINTGSGNANALPGNAAGTETAPGKYL